MLEDMRRHSRSTLIYVLFGILIAVFVLTFNTASRMGSGPEAAVEKMADVGGKSIDSAELNLAMLLSADPPAAAMDPFQKFQAKQLYEGSRLVRSGATGELATLTPHATAPAAKTEKVLTELVESVLVAEEGKKMGLGVSDDEVARRVFALAKANGTDLNDESGNFDPRKYDNFARYGLGTTKVALEELLRREILRDKMAQIVTQGIVVAPQEVDALFAADSKRPKLEVVALDASSAAKAVAVSDADATAWAAAHADKIAAEYKAQESTYKVADKVNIRAILVAAADPADASDDTQKQAATTERGAKKAAADAIKADLDKAWAGEVKLDPVAAPGEDSDKPVSGEPKTAAELQGDERTQRLVGHFSKVAEEKTEDTMHKDNGGNYVDDYDAEMLARQPFGPAVRDAVLAAAEMTLVGPVEGKKGWWVLLVEKKLPGKTTTLEEATPAIAKTLYQQEQAEKQLDSIADSVRLAADATRGTALADVLKDWAKKKGLAEDTLTATETPPLGKSPMEAMQDLSALFGGLPKTDSADDVPGVGRNPALAKAAWTLTKDKPVAAEVFKSEDGKTRYVVRLSTKEMGDAAADAKIKDQLGRSLTQLRRREAYRAYVSKLMTAATAAGQVKKTEAFTQKLKEEQAKLADEQKKAEADKPAIEAGAAGGIQLKVGDQPAQPLELKPAPAPAAAAQPPAAGPAPAGQTP